MPFLQVKPGTIILLFLYHKVPITAGLTGAAWEEKFIQQVTHDKQWDLNTKPFQF